MHITAHADVTVVSVQQSDELALLLELTAPPAAASGRPPASVQVVLDRSGSMAGERLEAAKRALDALVVRLDPADHFGLVAFDQEVVVVVPAAPLMDKAEVRRRIAAVHAGGSTNLSAGWLRGVQEARRTGARGTLLLLSDGHANDGIVDAPQLGEAADGARRAGVVTSTVGIGLDYDETVLSALARGGAGEHVFALGDDDAGAAVGSLVDGLLATTVQAASLTIRPSADVASVALLNDLPTSVAGGALVVELGDLHAGEQRKLALTLDVPAHAALGLAQVAELELRWVELPGLTERTHGLPVHVNVVPGDQAAGRIRDPRVRTELEYLRAQDAKRRAAELLREGRTEAAGALLQDAGESLAGARAAAPAAAMPEVDAELGVLADLVLRLPEDDPRLLSKRAVADAARKSRQRGR